MPFLHLDFETFSMLPIEHGTHNYLSHWSTELLMTAWALDDGPVQVEEGLTLSAQLTALLQSPDTTIVAFNAEFERLALKYICGIDLPPEKFLCTMALAWSLSFTGGLDKVGVQMGFPADKVKLKKGRQVMLKLSKPRRPSKRDPRTRWTRENASADWDILVEYGDQDVVASREVFRFVMQYGWDEEERDCWNADQRVNDFGWPLDMGMVSGANALLETEQETLRQHLEQVTGLDNPNSRDQFMGWMKRNRYTLPDMTKATVEAALKADYPPMPAVVREALTARAQLQRATPKKWQALKRCAHEGTIKATLEFGAASRTQRWGGRDFQPQNLYSARAWSPEQLMRLAKHIGGCTHKVFSFLYDDVQEALSAGIRPAVTAPEGYTLVVVDLASIESVLLGWVSGCERINGLFASGRDTYKDLATRVFGVKYDDVTKKQRTYCKPPELGCGYMLGAKGLVAYAADMGVTMSEGDADTIVKIWRAANPEVGLMWDWLKVNTMSVIRDEIAVAEGYRIRMWRDSNFLMIQLPSGRRIHYWKPAIVEGRYGPTVRYWGRNEKTGGGWGEIFTHPGKWTENIIQAIARDVLRDNVLRCSARIMPWAPLVGHVHDEGVWLTPIDRAEETSATAGAMMSAGLAWAPGLNLGCEGAIIPRYYKT